MLHRQHPLCSLPSSASNPLAEAFIQHCTFMHDSRSVKTSTLTYALFQLYRKLMVHDWPFHDAHLQPTVDHKLGMASHKRRLFAGSRPSRRIAKHEQYAIHCAQREDLSAVLVLLRQQKPMFGSDVNIGSRCGRQQPEDCDTRSPGLCHSATVTPPTITLPRWLHLLDPSFAHTLGSQNTRTPALGSRPSAPWVLSSARGSPLVPPLLVRLLLLLPPGPLPGCR